MIVLFRKKSNIIHTLGFVFSCAYKANTGNEEYDSEYAENDKCFNITRTAWDIDKYDGSIDKACYSEDSKQRSKDPFDIHNFNFNDLLPRVSYP